MAAIAFLKEHLVFYSKLSIIVKVVGFILEYFSIQWVSHIGNEGQGLCSHCGRP